MGHTGASQLNNCPKRKYSKLCNDFPRSGVQQLVGSKCTAQVKISGIECHCLLDTGSQVTTVPWSFYQACLSNHPIQSLNHLLEVSGANGQPVPYKGYIEIPITFPEDMVGSEVEIYTLALVVPDFSPEKQSQVLIGTNTLDSLYAECSNLHTLEPHSLRYGYKAVLKTLELRHTMNTSGCLGFVRLQSKEPVVIPAKQTVALCGKASINCLPVKECVLLEPPITSSLPGGLLFPSSVVQVPSLSHPKWTVQLQNESNRDVVLQPNIVVAEVHAIENILPQECEKSSVPSSRSRPKSVMTFDFRDSPLSPEWRDRISAKLNDLSDVFAQHDLDFGRTSKVKHRIKLSDETSFKQRARPIHPNDLSAVRRHLQELRESGVIRESDSPFSSPIVVVRKKNGDVRLCVDYRKLNSQTVKDSLPNLEESFSALSGSRWFTVLDLKSGYYQIEVEESDKHKTAFSCPLGFWEFNRMPQGITNAPSTFQRLMEKCMEDLHLTEVLVFLDDLIVFSRTPEEHEERLLKVLTRLREYGLKLSLEKCKFFQTSVRYLGHIISETGVQTDPEKISALKTWPKPKNLKELRSFLGFAGYYRRFIRDYSKIAKPLNDLTAGYAPVNHRTVSGDAKGNYFDPKDSFGSRWKEECDDAFETIISKLTSAPVLGFADPTLPYTLHTDASTTGLGAALYQEQDGENKVIAFASRGLSRSESRYPAHKLEFLALKWAVTEKFADYLYGNHFTVITDSNPLTYLLTSAKLDAVSYRWLSALATFSFSLIYRSGKQNQDADGLSQRPHGELVNDMVSKKEQERIQQFAAKHLGEGVRMDCAVVRAVCDKHLVQQECGTPVALVESLAMEQEAIPGCFAQDMMQAESAVSGLSGIDLQLEQREDVIISQVISHLEEGKSPCRAVRYECPDLLLLLREWNRLELKDGVLYRRRKLHDQTTYQLVLPVKFRALVLESLHDQMGHMGIDRTLDLVRSRFYWPKMSSDVERKVRTCERCVKRKAVPERSAPLVNIEVTRPLELLCIDFLSIEPDRSNVQNVLVMTDHYTKYAVSFPTNNQKASTVAKCLWDGFIVHYGFPERILSDRGADFESKLIKELCEMARIHKVRTTP